MVHLSPVAVVGVSTFRLLAISTKVVLGTEALVYYHHLGAILLAVALVVWLLDGAVLAHLDVAVLGVGGFLACGRVGCFFVGCCHGRPARVGVRYGDEHRDSGFSAHLVGVPVLPVQLVEAAWVSMTVLACLVLLRNAAAGTVLVTYVTVYGAWRFGSEFLRGDPTRSYAGAWSEAQWTSVALMAAIVVAGPLGVLPVRPWHVVVTAVVVAALVVISLRRRLRRDRLHQLLLPAHVREVALLVRDLPTLRARLGPAKDDALRPLLGRTSSDLLISVARNSGSLAGTSRCTVSLAGGRALSLAEARRLANVLSLVERIDGRFEVQPASPGVFHLVATPVTTESSTAPIAAASGPA